MSFAAMLRRTIVRCRRIRIIIFLLAGTWAVERLASQLSSTSTCPYAPAQQLAFTPIMTLRAISIRSRIWGGLLFIGLISIGIAVRFSILRMIGHALVIDELPRRVDVIVVPGWTGDAGAIEAADLVRRGIASDVAVVLNPPDASDRELIRRNVLHAAADNWTVSLLHQLGVANVTPIDFGNGTQAEMMSLAAWLDSHQVHSILVVTLPDHARRVRRLLDRSLRGHGVTAVVHSTQYSDFHPDTWWKTRSGLRTGIEESEKLFLDLVAHPFN